MNRRIFVKFSTLSATQIAAWSVLAKSGMAEKFIQEASGVFNETDDAADLSENFMNPADQFRAGGYWWWFNGLMNKEGITRDLEEFKAKGIGEVLLVNTSSGLGGAHMPKGYKLFSPEWRELYKHALTEAHRLGIKVGVNLSAGWCMGGPWIPKQHSGRWFLQSQLTVTGPQKFTGRLPLPGNRDGYDKMVNAPGYKQYIDLPLEELDYRDTAVVAIPAGSGNRSLAEGKRKELFPAKTNRKDASNFIKWNDVMGPVQEPWPALPGDEPIAPQQVIDLTAKMTADGRLEWEVPAGTWTIIRTGHRMTGSKLMIANPEADGLSVDWLSHEGVDLQFEHMGNLLLQDAGELKGKTLTYFCDDSFEDGFPNWTEAIIEKFKYYRGYDPVPYLPVLRGFIIGSAAMSDRFLHDYRKTVADCMADGHYKYFADRCHKNGILVQNEAAGPSRSGTMCMDGLKNLGRSDMPMGEFWLGLKHDEEGGLDDSLSYGVSRLESGQNKVTKMTASAAHIYGRKTASAESFTSFRHWLDYPGNLKQSTDRAFCEGINRFIIHTTTASRPEDGKPGYEYGAGTHFNPNVTWWEKAGPFLQYISRCQYLLRQGLFVADVLYYNGDDAPNIVAPKHVDPSLGKGYDYDVCNEEVLLIRLSVKKGRIVLPDGMSYRMLVLPGNKRMPVPVIKKIQELVKAGAIIVGPKPVQDPGLKDYPACDDAVKNIAAKVWGNCNGVTIKQHAYGKGMVYWNVPLREILAAKGIVPDCIHDGSDEFIDFIHRSTGDAEIYFITNRHNRNAKVSCSFRVAGKMPELWNPLTGETTVIADFEQSSGITTIPLQFAPFQSWFIVFRKPVTRNKYTAFPPYVNPYPQLSAVQELSSNWAVQFDEQWGGPGSIIFDKLYDWSQRPEEGIKYYSGTAVYHKQFDMPAYAPGTRYFLELGVVKNIAEVKLNGQQLGIIWTHPWQVEITYALQEKDNQLEIEVVNLWPNRLIGDAALPEEQRLTRTNITFKKDAPLLPSGLLGPVKISKEVAIAGETERR